MHIFIWIFSVAGRKWWVNQNRREGLCRSWCHVLRAKQHSVDEICTYNISGWKEAFSRLLLWFLSCGDHGQFKFPLIFKVHSNYLYTFKLLSCANLYDHIGPCYGVVVNFMAIQRSQWNHRPSHLETAASFSLLIRARNCTQTIICLGTESQSTTVFVAIMKN